MNDKNEKQLLHPQRLARAVGVAGVALLCATSACATLINNGAGLIWDSELNITWWDATHISEEWRDASDWAESLSEGGVAGWRLPMVSGPTSELSHLFHNTDRGLLTNLKFAGLDSENLWNPALYWSAAAANGSAVALNFTDGQEELYAQTSPNFYALAVHEGNIGTRVPDGGLTAILLGAGMLTLTCARRLVK